MFTFFWLALSSWLPRLGYIEHSQLGDLLITRLYQSRLGRKMIILVTVFRELFPGPTANEGPTSLPRMLLNHDADELVLPVLEE